MPQINFSLSLEEDEKVIEYSKNWKMSKRKMSKPDTIKKMIKLFEEKENANIR